MKNLIEVVKSYNSEWIGELIILEKNFWLKIIFFKENIVRKVCKIKVSSYFNVGYGM